jgi:hypothetical protein
MIHVSPRHKVVGVPLRADLQTLFPTAKTVRIGGEELILLPHGFTETKLLRNLGMEVPAPILAHYDWAGGKPFEVQKKTAALLTTHQRAYVLNGMGCVDADTEYLSPDGWVRIADYPGGNVAQYHPDTGEIEFVEPTEFVKLPCVEMIRFKTSRGVDQLLSPEHRVLLADGRVMQAEEIEKWYGSARSKDFKFRTTFKVRGAPGVPWGDALIRLQVAVNADGYQRDDWDQTTVRLKKPRKIERLRKLLTDAGFFYKESTCRTTGYQVFRFVAPDAKGFGPIWWGATQTQLEVIADEAVHWDGSARKAGGESFSSYSKRDADFIQYAYSAAGRRASLETRTRNRRGTVETDHVVHAKAGNPDVGLYGVNGGQVRQNVWREPSPDGFKYCFKVPSTFLLLRRNGKIFATGNTGKTKSALWSADYLMSQGLAKRALVVAPLSTLNFTWAREVFNTTPHRTVGILHGTSKKRHDRLAEEQDFYVVNPDGIGVIREALTARPDIDMLIIDELAMFRNGASARNKLMRTIADRMAWVWGMTGSPTPNEPTDAWGQCRIVTPHTVPKFFGRFRDEVMVKVSQFRYVAKRDAAETVLQVMQPAVRFSLDDVVELPEMVERTQDIELGAKQGKVYEALRLHAHSAVESGEITAANAGAVLNKLLQVSLGYVYAEKNGERVVHELDNDLRLDALVDAVNACAEKVLVFVPFTHALDGIVARLKQEGIDVAAVSGATSRTQREHTFSLFQNTDKVKVIAAHPATMSHGLTLTAASLVVWFGPTTSLETFEQANARVRRIGQTKKQQTLMFQATAAERRIYTRLRARQAVQNNLLELFAEQS